MGSAERLVGALCAETHGEWSTGRRYLTMDKYFEWRTNNADEGPLDEPTSLNGEPGVQSATVPA